MRNTETAYPLCDLHSHVLPGIDDGCRTAEESLRILADSRSQGIDRIAATPHYYSEQPVARFLEKRREALEQVLTLAGDGTELPELRLGAEVAYHPGLVYEDRLPELCYEGTRFLLLEMPFSAWSQTVLRDVALISAQYGITPVIAHLERYGKLAGKAAIRELLSMDVLVQVNAAYILEGRPAFRVRKLLREHVHVLGSDCHNLTNRRQNLGAAREKLLAWGMEEELETIRENSLRLLHKQ